MFRSKRNRLIHLLCCLSALLGIGSANAQINSKGLLGMQLSDALKTEFFNWFHLRETDRHTEDGNKTIVTFKPEGESVRDFVTLYVSINAQREITSLRLDLSRTFADDNRSTGMLARDISKSLLLDAVPDADLAFIRDLATAIAAPPKNSRKIVLTQKPVKQPDPRTPGYQAFVGNESKFSKEYTHCRVTIENITQNGELTLEITVAD
jgi:hypothetical protein